MRSRARALLAGLSALGLFIPSGVGAQSPAENSALGPDGPSFPVEEFVIRYGNPFSDLPPLDDLLPIRVPLSLTPTGYVAAQDPQAASAVTVGGP
ncbi:MAG TPA: hypothetical protein EYQ54_11925, partial [Myxococcales bacterium]|nr:hypothetical protein [Myxococcales bacterium]